MTKAWKAGLAVVFIVLVLAAAYVLGCSYAKHRRAKIAALAAAAAAAASAPGGGIIGGDDEDDDDVIEGGAPRADFGLALRPPMYAAFLEGSKTVEGRLNRGRIAEVKVGDEIDVRRSRAPDDKTEYPGERRVRARVTSRKEYPSFRKMLEGEGLDAVLPGVKTAAKGVEHYREFYTEDDEKTTGVVALGLKKL